MNSFFNFVTELNCGVCHNKNDISSMARAGFIDHRRAKVEAKMAMLVSSALRGI